MLNVTYYDLKGSSFIAKGSGRNRWTVVKVAPGKCVVRRDKDGLNVSIDTQLLLTYCN